MAHPVTFERDGRHYSTHGTLPQLEHGTNNVISRLPHYDLLTFLAICQNIPSLQVATFMPKFDDSEVRYGQSGQVYGFFRRKHQTGIALKRFRTSGTETKAAFQALISEVMVLEHPVFKKHPNLPQLGGITWDVNVQNKDLIGVMPVLIFKRSKYGSLRDYLSSRGSPQPTASQRLQLCVDIGRAIEALHAFNIVHGDIKPDNVLVDEERSGRLVAKVIDFGCSSFGTTGSDRIILAYTPEWVAPEWRAGSFTIDEAKMTDVYSYGKVCSWILFGMHAFPNEVVDTRFDFGRALEAQPLTRTGTSIEHQAHAALGRFFELSLKSDPSERISDLSGLLDLLQESIQGLDCDENSRHQGLLASLLLSTRVPTAFPFRQIGFYLRVQVGRLLVYCLLGRESEFFIPGQAQAMFYVTAGAISALVFILEGLAAISMLGFIAFFAVTYHRRSARYSGDHNVLWTFVALLLVLAAVIYLSRNSTFWIDLRDSSRTFRVFGRSQHLVPKLSQLVTRLDSVHYLIKVQIVKDLKARLQSCCEQCQRASALQLALCAEVAFGTSRDPKMSQKWLQESGKKEADILKLCYEAAHYRVTDKASRRLFDGYVDSYDPIAAKLFDLYKSDGLISEAIFSYEEEIAGRTALGFDRLADKLYLICGWCYMAIYDLEKAEEMFKKGLSRVCARKRLRQLPSISDMWYGSNDNLGYDVALTLASQYRVEEAIETILSHSRSVMRNPNGKETWVHFFHGGNRCVESRILLAELLIYQGRLDDCLRMNMLSDLKDLLRTGQKTDRDVLKVLANMSALVDALFKKKRMTLATEVQRARLVLTKEVFGFHDGETLEATYMLGLLLSHQSSSEVDEAINLLSTINHQRALGKNHFTMRTRYAQAFALGRRNKLSEALGIMQEVRDTIRSTWGPYHPKTMGCMSHLAPSLGAFREDDISKVCSVQQDISDMCVQENHVGIQQDMLSLLLTLSIPEAIREALQRMRELIKLMEALYKDTNRSYIVVLSSFVFLLSAEGFLFEQHAMLTEASDACISLLRTANRTYGKSSFEYLEAKDLFASVLMKKTMLLYQNHGFGARDFELLNSAVKIHRELLDLSVEILGNEHDKTLTARIDCARALSEHGTAVFHVSEQAEAETLFRSAFETRRNVLGLDHLSTLWAESQMINAWYRHGRISSADAEQYQHSYVTKLAERKGMNQPFRALQTAKLISMLLRSGNHGPEALKSAQSLYNYYKKSLGKQHPVTIRALQTISLLEHKNGQAVDVTKFRCVFWRAKTLLADLGEQISQLKYRHKLIGAFEIEGKDDEKVLKMQEDLMGFALGLLGKQHTTTIGIMIQHSQMLSRRSQRPKALAVLKEALSIAASLVGIRHNLTLICWRGILDVLQYGESKKAVVGTLIEQNVLMPLKIMGKNAPWEESIALEEKIRCRAKDAGLGFHVLGENHPFTFQMRVSFNQLLSQVPGIQPEEIEDIIGRAIGCTELPDATRSFLQQCPGFERPPPGQAQQRSS